MWTKYTYCEHMDEKFQRTIHTIGGKEKWAVHFRHSFLSLNEITFDGSKPVGKI